MKLPTDKRIIIISGHYGTGKTNIAVNLALSLAKENKKARLVDLDIVNPYFRSADNRRELEEAGVKPILPQFANTNVDIPSLPQEYYSVFTTDETCIIDVGGDSDGAIILAVDHERYIKSGYAMYFVYNKSRPYIADPEDALRMLRSIEKTSHLRFDGIINNTNMGEETTPDLIVDSLADAAKLAELSGLPLVATTALQPVKGVDEITLIDNKTKQYF